MQTHPMPSPPFSGHLIETRDGTRLHWMQWGPQSGARESAPPVLFLNSAGMPLQMWDYQMLALAAAGYRCIGYDRRGHGKSDQPPDGYDYNTLAADLDDVITHLRLRKLTLIGHSMAGGEIVRYLSRHGSERIARIVLIGTMTPFLSQTSDNPEGIPVAAADAQRDSWRKDYPRWIAENTDPFFVPETSPAMARWLSGLLMQFPPRLAIACNEAVTRTDFREDLRKVTVPALVIHGDRDASAPIALTGKRTAELIPQCRFKVYRGAPHGLLYTHMDQLHADLLQFMQETR